MDTISNDDMDKPLLSGLENASNQFEGKLRSSRRRYRRCRSAPAVDPVAEKAKVSGPLPLSGQGFHKFHPSFKQVFVFLGIYIGVGTLCFFYIQKQIDGKKTNGVIDAIYFCIVTMTTVGYGDLVPASDVAKLLACAFVFTGMALVGLILGSAADYLVEKQELYFIKALHVRKKVSPSDIVKELQSNRVKYKVVMISGAVFVLIVMGTVYLYKIEKLNLVDAFYCVCSTITTLGYGDKSFSTEGGRTFAIIWILISTVCVALLFLYLAEWATEHRQQSLAKWVLTRKMTFLDLEAADMDDDGVVSPAEFVIYKLKEMEKISEEDVSRILEEFDNLDVDKSGTLTLSDLALAHQMQ
ncbi:two-pore potassium channel 1 [Nymphaea colorata]|nr:two-pore potassium channel 1 [Nymphaea colorata]